MSSHGLQWYGWGDCVNEASLDDFTDLDDPGCENDQDDDESMQRLTISVKKTDDWGAGYCSDVSITNNTADPIDWKVTLKADPTTNYNAGPAPYPR